MRKTLNFWDDDDDDDDEMFCNHVRVVTVDAKRVDCSLLDISGGLVAKKSVVCGSFVVLSLCCCLILEGWRIPFSKNL